MKFLVYGGERCIWISLLLASLELTIFSLNNIVNPDFSGIGGLISFIAACCVFGFILGLPVVVFMICDQGYNNLWNPEWYERYAYIFCEFRLDSRVRNLVLNLIILLD